MFKYVHHVHYAVEDVDAVIEYLEKNFGMKPERVQIGKSTSPAKEAIYHAGVTEIQVTEPLTKDSALARHIQDHGPGIYHIGWGVEEIEALEKHVVATGNKMRRKGVDVSPLGYKTLNIEPSPVSQGLHFQLVETFDTNG
jgi:methylmalonyl-CoA/ethylmalonyl-CoA epimerase